MNTIGGCELTFGVGPAGTGKTFLAVAIGVEMLMRNSTTIKKMIITRPAVEAGESLGFLPGDMIEKVDPYMRPIFDALYDTLGSQTDQYLDDGTIEIAPIAFMRGRTLKNAVIILDEAQNTTRAQMKMFLTRIGHDTKTIVNGDMSQIDLPHGERISGLTQAARILPPSHPLIGITEFTEEFVDLQSLIKQLAIFDLLEFAELNSGSSGKHGESANGSLTMDVDSLDLAFLGGSNRRERSYSAALAERRHWSGGIPAADLLLTSRATSSSFFY